MVKPFPLNPATRSVAVELRLPAGEEPLVGIPGRCEPVIIPRVPGSVERDGTALFAAQIRLSPSEFREVAIKGGLEVDAETGRLLEGTSFTGRRPPEQRPLDVDQMLKQWAPSKPGTDLAELEGSSLFVQRVILNQIVENERRAAAEPDPIASLRYELRRQRDGQTTPLEDRYIGELFARVEVLARQLAIKHGLGTTSAAEHRQLTQLAAGPLPC